MHVDTLRVMADGSEVIPYTTAGIPLFIKAGSVPADSRSSCHWHMDLEFAYVLDGTICYNVNGKKIRLLSGDTIFVNARQFHFGINPSNGSSALCSIVIHPELLAGNAFLYERDVEPYLSVEEYLLLSGEDPDKNFAAQHLQEAVRIRYDGAPHWELRALSVLTQLWCRLTDRLHKDKRSSDDPGWHSQQAMISFIHLNFQEKLSLNDIAAAGHVSRSKCCELFKHYTQETPVEFLNHYRLEVSHDRLLSTDKSVTEIALSCGFGNSSYFGKQFAELYGCSPLSFRKGKALGCEKMHSLKN